jgi:hypothetical protein
LICQIPEKFKFFGEGSTLHRVNFVDAGRTIEMGVDDPERIENAGTGRPG